MAMYGDLFTCRRKYLVNYFDEATDEYCGNCDVCLTRTEMVDGTTAAQKVLSAITRLQQGFGAAYVIDFLRGSSSSKIRESHKALKTFGIGTELNKEAWSSIIQDLLAQGYLTKSGEFRPVLKLTPKSEMVLKRNERVFITKSKLKIEAAEQESEHEADLLLELKDVRRQIAFEENVPAYNVLSDASLMEIATYLPHNKEEFRKISGFGEIKIERYGRQFWTMVADYCTERRLGSRIHLKAPKRVRGERSPERDNETKQQTFDLFKQGLTIGTIASMRGLSSSTIEGHLAFYVQQGKLKIDQLMDPAKARPIQKAIERIGGNSLSPIKGTLGEIYSFGEIKIVMAHLEFLKQQSLESQPTT
jgi:ATP-dependent DNA helicase RecQ